LSFLYRFFTYHIDHFINDIMIGYDDDKYIIVLFYYTTITFLII